MAKRLVTVGDLVVDIVLDAVLPLHPNQHQTAKRLRFEAGGACTTILAARKMGLDIAALGTVGDDLQGRMLLDILDDAAVDTSALVIPPGSATTTVVALSDSGQGGHVFLGHYGEGADIDFTDVAEERLDASDAIFIPGYTLAEARLSPLVAGVCDWLAKQGGRFYFDVGPFARHLTQAQIDQVLSLCHILLLTEDEIPFVAEGALGLDACRRLCAQYAQLTIALKLGAAGCRIISRDLDLVCPGFTVDVVDTVGAGDAFASAYIWADLNGYSPRACGAIANAMGAASVAKAGAGASVPAGADVQSLLDRENTGINISC
ncbi:MAG: carbohydrate kinase family protein [Chloroflexota bacterium]|nr:carbohydrate kinase family protein [Chloroflexota bacterium]MDE2911237.1 carbohydrate kinase family protein [Chloroflexota bacterium]